MSVKATWEVIAVKRFRTGAAICAVNPETQSTTVFEVGSHTMNGQAFLLNVKEGSRIEAILELIP